MTIPYMAVQGGGFALTGIGKAIMALYGVASDINTFVDEHIKAMRNSDNATVAQSGRVLEGAKYGFGIGYIVPVAIITVGQVLLGNHLAAIGTVASAAVLANPVAMTCAAIGAIYYGWNALSATEQSALLRRLHVDLEVGVELIKSIISFVIAKTKELLSSENFKELKQFISEAAGTFGKTLGDVTRAIKDHVVGAVDTVVQTAVEAGQTMASAVDSIKQSTSAASESVISTLRKLPPKR